MKVWFLSVMKFTAQEKLKQIRQFMSVFVVLMWSGLSVRKSVISVQSFWNFITTEYKVVLN